MKKLIIAALVATTLSGCASNFNIGAKELSGPVPQGFACADGVKAMELTNDYLNGDNLDADFCKQQKDKKNALGSNGVAGFGGITIPDMNIIDDPKPVLMPAQVMRIWINAYETEDGSLAYPGRIFTEITPRKWNVGYSAQKGMTGNRTISPLAVRVEEEDKQAQPALQDEKPADTDNQEGSDTDTSAIDSLTSAIQDNTENPQAPLRQ